MKQIITSALLAIAVFCMAAPNNNSKPAKQERKAVTADEKDKGKDEQKKNDAKPKDREAKERKLIESKNSISFENNGGGRTSYH